MVYTCLYKPTFRWWLIQPIYADSGDGWLLILLGLPHESFGLGWNRWKFRCCKSCKSQACPPGRYAPEAATPQCQADIHADVYTVYIYIYNFFNTHIIMIYIMMYIASHWLFNLWYPLVISLWSMLVSQPARLPVGSHWGRSRHDDALSFSDAQACPQGEYNPLRNQSRCAVCPFGAQWLGKHRRRQHGYCIIQITQAHVGGWSGLCTLRFIWCKSQVESILPIRPHFPNTMFLPRCIGHYCTLRSIGPYRVLLMQSTARFCPSCYGGFNGTGATSFYADEGFYLLGSDEDVTHLMLLIGWDKSDLFGWALAVRP